MNRGFSGPARLPRGGVNPLVVGLSVVMLACFVIAALYFFWLTQPAPNQSAVAPVGPSELDLVDVLVPIDRIDAGTALEPTMFRKESRPAVAVGSSNVKDFDQIRGAYAASFIAAGQPLLTEYVTLKKPVNSLQAVIPDGYRAVTLAVDNTTSVEGWARPGAKVDVVLASMVNNKRAATVIIQNAKVLSAGREVQDKQGKDQGPQTVTLMVTVDEAAKLQLASSSGLLSLSLRGDEDTIESPSNATITIDSILGGDNSAKPAIIPPEGRVKIDGRQFVIINGKLVPEESVNR